MPPCSPEEDLEADNTDVVAALMKYVKMLPQLAVTREEYRALLRAKR